jgi:MFS family permease
MPYVIGLAFLGCSTLLFALARSLVILEFARILQGFASGIAATIGMALLLDKVGQKNIGEAMGWVSVSVMVGFFSGPVIGGIPYRYTSYFTVFVPAFVLIILEIGLRLMILENGRSSQGLLIEGSGASERGYGTMAPIQAAVSLPADSSNVTMVHDEGPPSVQNRLQETRSPIIILLGTPRMLVAMFSLFNVNGFSGCLESVVSHAYNHNQCILQLR